MYAKLPVQIFTDELGALSQPAKLLHLAALCRCAALLSDGDLPIGQLLNAAASVGVYPFDSAVAELIGAGLWEARDDGAHHLPTYLRDNPSREAAERKGWVRSEVGRMGGVKSGEARRAKRAEREANEPIALPIASPIAVANGKQTVKQNTKQNRSSISISTSSSLSTSASARARDLGDRPVTDLPVPVPLHAELWPGQRSAFDEFARAYPKIVPPELWPVFRGAIPDAATWEDAARGLAEYNACDQWMEDPQRYATAPGKWLGQRFWTKPAPGAGRSGVTNDGRSNAKARSGANDAIAAQWQPGAAFGADVDNEPDR